MFKKSIKLQPGCAQHQGDREDQQDSFGFSDFYNEEIVNESGYLSVLADGMGGLQNGKEASQIAVNTVLHTYINKSVNEPVIDALRRSITVANEAIYNRAKTENILGQMGTTIVCSVVYNGLFYFMAVGDSRIYLVKKNKILQLNEDHNYSLILDESVEAGEISVEEAEESPERNYLISFLGMDEIERMSSNDQGIKLDKDDIILLCSDGLTNTLTESQIIKIINNNRKKPQKIADSLIVYTLKQEKEYQDNVTVIVLRQD